MPKDKYRVECPPEICGDDEDGSWPASVVLSSAASEQYPWIALVIGAVVGLATGKIVWPTILTILFIVHHLIAVAYERYLMLSVVRFMERSGYVEPPQTCMCGNEPKPGYDADSDSFFVRCSACSRKVDYYTVAEAAVCAWDKEMHRQKLNNEEGGEGTNAGG